ncbi:MAG TPA: ferritin [Methanoregulaceae archaeon]|nr:ferritin [Methanoregulaceae archaeon]
MLKPTIEAALNRQLNRELYSSYLYLAMSAYYDSINLPGFSSWLRIQAKEELGHAMKFYDYLSDAGGRPVMEAIEAPPKEWAGPKEAFAEVVAHERAVTGMIWALMDLAQAEKDHATAIFLQWFVTEQVEEEKSTGAVMAQLEAVGGSVGSLYGLDHHLAKR